MPKLIEIISGQNEQIRLAVILTFAENAKVDLALLGRALTHVCNGLEVAISNKTEGSSPKFKGYYNIFKLDEDSSGKNIFAIAKPIVHSGDFDEESWKMWAVEDVIPQLLSSLDEQPVGVCLIDNNPLV